MLWLLLGASFFFSAQADEMLTSKEGRRDDGKRLRRGDAVFFWARTQLDLTMWSQADRVEVGFGAQNGTNCGT